MKRLLLLLAGAAMIGGISNDASAQHRFQQSPPSKSTPAQGKGPNAQPSKGTPSPSKPAPSKGNVMPNKPAPAPSKPAPSKGVVSPTPSQKPSTPPSNAQRPSQDKGNNTPPPSSGQRPNQNVGQTPPPSGGHQPAPGNGHTPPPSNGQKPNQNGGHTPHPGNGHTPPPSGGHQPAPNVGHTPPPGNGHTPPPGNGHTPPPPGGIHNNHHGQPHPHHGKAHYTRYNCNHLRVMEDRGTGLYGYLNNFGRWAIPPQYRYAKSFNHDAGLAVVRLANGLWGAINARGQVVIEFNFTSSMDVESAIRSILNGRYRGVDLWAARDHITNLYGYLDFFGQWYITPQFKYAKDPSNNGIAIVQFPYGRWGAIDRNGQIVIDPNYDSSSDVDIVIRSLGLYY